MRTICLASILFSTLIGGCNGKGADKMKGKDISGQKLSADVTYSCCGTPYCGTSAVQKRASLYNRAKILEWAANHALKACQVLQNPESTPEERGIAQDTLVDMTREIRKLVKSIESEQ